VDDEFELLRDPEGQTPPDRRPAWLLVGGLVAVVLLALVGVVWMVSSVSGRGGTISAAATSTSAPAVTAPPTTAVAATTDPPVPTPAPTTTVPLPTATFTVPVVPVPSAATVAPTTKPAPTRPAPKPTPSTPVGKLVRVPDVTGLRVKAAIGVLRGAGLKVQVLGGVLSPDRDDRRVTAQRPTPGSVVRAGSTVILVTDGL
jgi:PASTA domain